MKSKVSLVKGDDRKENLQRSLKLIEEDLRTKLREKDDIVIKPNFVSSSTQLATTHVDAADALMRFLESLGVEKFTVAESSAINTKRAFRNFGFHRLKGEHDVELVDLNDGPSREVRIDHETRTHKVRVSEMLLDESNFVISLARLKTHDYMVATLTIKNLLMGAILKPDKSSMHKGHRVMSQYLATLAEELFPDLGVIDGFKGMEGNGPISGDPVDSKVAISSTDPMAADFVGLKCMEIDPEDVGYLYFMKEKDLGSYSFGGIEIVGSSIDSCRKKYELHDRVDRQLSWKE